MQEIRIDPLSGLKVIIASERAQRPGSSFELPSVQSIDPDRDPFAEGHEDQTPPELFAVRDNDYGPNRPGWKVRAVPNLYPALDPEAADIEDDPNPALFHSRPARGNHEVIINSPRCVENLGDLSLAELTETMEVWRLRMQAHGEAAFLHLIVNESKSAGASLPHTHAQLYAFSFVPTLAARERERFNFYATETMGRNLLQDIVAEEVKRKERIVEISEDGVLFAPFASQAVYQLMIAPRQPRKRFQDDGPLCSELLHSALARLKRFFGQYPPLNMWIRTAPSGSDHFCWRIDILPRLTHLAALELGSGVMLNIITPERAAEELAKA